MQRLVLVGLGGRNIVLKSVGDRGEHVVYQPQRVIAFGCCIDDQPDCIDIIDFLKRLALDVNFSVDAVD